MGIARNLGLLVIGVSVGTCSVSLIHAQEIDFSIVSQGIDTLTNTLGDVFNSHEQLQQAFPDVELPQPLKEWLAEFAEAPFENSQSVTNQLANVESQLNSQISMADLSEEVGDVLQHFVYLVNDIGQKLSLALLGADYNPIGAELAEITTLHNRDQSWIEQEGQQLASLFQQFNFEGVVDFLRTTDAEYHARD